MGVEDGNLEVPAVWQLWNGGAELEPLRVLDRDGTPLLMHVMTDDDYGYDDILPDEPCTIETFGRNGYVSKGGRHRDADSLLRELYESVVTDEEAVRDLVEVAPDRYRLTVRAPEEEPDDGVVTLEHVWPKDGEWHPELAWPTGSWVEEGTDLWNRCRSAVCDGFNGYDPTENVAGMWQVGDDYGMDLCDLLCDDVPAMLQVLNRHMAVEVVYMLDHSGISYRAGLADPYHDPWDSGPVGLAYMDPDGIRETFVTEDVTGSLDQAHGLIRSVVGEMDEIAQGHVFGYELLDADGFEVRGHDDSCWGFVGDDQGTTGAMLEEAAVEYVGTGEEWERVLAVDTETTGLEDGVDEVLQVGIVDAWTGDTVLSTLVRPDHTEEWPEAEAVNGITPQMVAGAPSQAHVAGEVQAVLEGADLVIAYNARFDMGFLRHMGVDLTGVRVRDVMSRWSEAVAEPDPRHGGTRRQSLARATEQVGYDWGTDRAHGARADARACAGIWRHMIASGLAGRYAEPEPWERAQEAGESLAPTAHDVMERAMAASRGRRDDDGGGTPPAAALRP